MHLVRSEDSAPSESSRWPERLLLAGTGVLAASAGWLLGGPMLDFLRELWLHTLLPSYLSLHLSGLSFCH